MSVSSFQDAVTLYEKSASTTITRHRIEHFTLGKFCVGFNSFYTMLGDLASEDYWQKFLIPLKRLRFGLCAAPFPRNYRIERVSAIADDLKHHLRFCQSLYPDLADHAINILSLLTELNNYTQDPLLDKLLELTDAEQRVAWVIKESRLIPDVEKLVAEFNLPKLNIVHPLQLKGLECYDRLIIIGPSRWFPESVFTAPRANRIDILIFDWIKDRWKPQNVFVNPHKSSGPSNRNHLAIEERETSSRWDDLDPETLLIIVDKTSSIAFAANNENDQDEYERVGAVCVFLENDWVVFIEASEGATTLVLDPDEDIDNRITRITMKEIKPGMFILVRTGSGGDYIISVADKILETQAPKAREYQRHWKELLRNYAKRNGLFKTSIDLLDHGSELANEINLRNWMSPRSIRTQNDNDFRAIMKLIGLEDRVEEYWDMMKRINKAHLKAGFKIRRLLLEQVKDLNMEKLQKLGKMDFKLANDDEAGLTAYRVESVLTEVVEVPYSRIGKPFKLEDQLWHE